VALSLLSMTLLAAEQSQPAVTSLSLEPAEIVLHAANRQQQLLITGITSGGRRIDLTRQAQVSIADPEIAHWSAGTLVGQRRGNATISVKFADLVVERSIQVQDIADFPPIHFGNDVMPILTKLGCNSGGCHGRQNGQNGFKLSVFGYDAPADYDAITIQSRGRRVFPANPEASLLISKPSGRVPHGGGLRLKPGSLDYETVRQWIYQGLPKGSDQAPRLVGLRVSPAECQLPAGGTQQILATAVYSDGSLRDVSAAALYSSNAPAIAETDPRGLTQCGQIPGEAAITVNYMGQVAAMQVISPRSLETTEFSELPLAAGNEAAGNEIDALVRAKLRKMGLPPSGPIDDATFLRRSTLDAIGTLPTPDEVRAFLADPSLTKRANWVDRLLARDEYADYWALKWADILMVDREKLGERGAFTMHRWLREQFAANRPYDAWVRELIAASGDSGKSGPVNFYRSSDTPDALARTVSQAFLGVRIECAQCHHHPFEKWSQTDFYGFAGYFNGLERKPIATDRMLVYHPGYREIQIPGTEQLVPARPLGAQTIPNLASGDPRVALSEWLTSPENPWFARLAVNRLWKHFLGRGLVESEDDLRTTNPPTNGPLLDLLAERLVESKFDLKAVTKIIMTSGVYQLSSQPNPENQADEQNFSHFMVKRLPAEVLLDAISSATETPEQFPGRPLGIRAIALWDNRLPSYFLEIFGRPERTSPCECGRSSDPTMAQALHLMNAPEVESKISHPQGRVARLLAANLTEEAIVEELCLATVGRFPRESDRQIARNLFQAAPPREAAEDFLWTLLNSYDFLFIK
jgi:Protein of unknown function (DUF1553)/Protein of unknown function (DUF1549)